MNTNEAAPLPENPATHAPDTGGPPAGLARYPQAVVVITANRDGGDATGIVADGLAPATPGSSALLWTMNRHDGRAAALEGATHWCANVLAYDQQALADRFAADDATGFQAPRRVDGIAALDACAATLLCRRTAAFVYGDSLILVGEVVRAVCHDVPALLRHDGADAIAVRLAPQASAPPEAAAATAFSYLLGSTFFHLYGKLREVGGRLGFNNIEMFVLTALGERSWRSRHEIESLLSSSAHPTDLQCLDDLEARGLIVSREAGGGAAGAMTFDLTAPGREIFARFSHAGLHVQHDMEALLGSADTVALRALLRRFVKKIEGEAKLSWF